MASKVVLLALLAAILVSAAPADAANGQTIAAYVKAQLKAKGNYTLMVQAFDRIGLTGLAATYFDLDPSSSLTIFAPTDAAVRASIVPTLTTTQLTNVFLFHAARGYLSARGATRLRVGATLTTFYVPYVIQKKSTSPLRFADTSVRPSRAPKVIAPNVVRYRTRVVVHGIDKVMIPRVL